MLRSGSKLRIETGRHERPRLEVKDRSCLFCGQVEDEKHFLAECNLYRFVRLELRHTANVKCPTGPDEFGKWILSGEWSTGREERNAVTTFIRRLVTLRETSWATLRLAQARAGEHVSLCARGRSSLRQVNLRKGGPGKGSATSASQAPVPPLGGPR